MLKTTDNFFVLLLLCISGVFMLVISFVLIFIRNQNKLMRQQKQLQEAEMAHQQELLQTVIESQEAERKRIGQDLHDDVGTALSNLRITIEMFSQDTGGGKFKETCKAIIDDVIHDVRSISHNLSPPGIELYGFVGALEDLCESITNSGKIAVTVNNNAGHLPDAFPQNTSIALYRVVQELLNNTIKHSGASEVNINLIPAPAGITISYHDNGRGMPAPNDIKKGMGILNIESRLGIIGASYSVSAPGGRGFSMEIIIENTINVA